MRIIAGTHKGRIIKMPKGKAIRPTQDRVREAVFNIVRERIPDSRVLDLYAGSGAFGIEALSRGAQLSVFVDNNAKCIKTIKFNLSSLGFQAESFQIFKKDGVTAIIDFKKRGFVFDIIFMDPPYYKEIFASRTGLSRPGRENITSLARNSLIKIGVCDILSQHAFIVCEHFVKDFMPDETEKLALFKQRRYGDTCISFYQHR